MKKSLKKILVSMLVLAVVINLLPVNLLVKAEADTGPVTVTATYDGTSGLEEVNVTDTGNVTFNIEVTQATTEDNILTIQLPTGVELVTAPGITSVDTSGNITSKDYVTGTESNYFDDVPTWTPTGAVDDVLTKAGTLVYDLKATNVTFSVTANINPQLVPIAEESITSLMGNVKVTLTTNDDESTEMGSDKVIVKVTSQAVDLQVSLFTSQENFNNSSLNTFCTTNFISNDRTNIHSFRFQATLNTSIEGSSYSIPIYYNKLDITYPEGTEFTFITTPVTYEEEADTLKDNGDGTNTKTIISNNDITTSTGLIACTLGTIDYSDVYDETTPSGTVYSLTADNIEIQTRTFNVTTQEFDEIIIGEKSDAKSITTTATLSGLVDSILYNPFYDSELTENEEYNDYTGTTQLLYYAKRGLNSTTKDWLDTGATSPDGTTNPILMEYEAIPDVDSNSYLDQVTEVTMDVPFLGQEGTERYTSQLTSVTIWYDRDDVGDIGISTETGHTLDISDFQEMALDGSLENAIYSKSVAVDTSGIATYQWTASGGLAQNVPSITFTAPEGYSIVKISMEFTGDNSTLWRNSTDYAGSTIMGIPYNDEYTGVYSQYQFTTYELQNSEWIEKTTSEVGGFRWKEPLDFELTLEDSSLTNQAYYYNKAKYNTEIYVSSSPGNCTDGYQNLGSVNVSNKTGSASPDGEYVVFDFEKDDTSSDVIKTIRFPIDPIEGEDGIMAIEYTYDNGSIHLYYTDSGKDAPYTIVEDSTGTYGVIEASGDNSFASAQVALNSWGSNAGSSEFALYGYIDDTAIDNLTGTDSHKISYAIYDSEGNTVGSTGDIITVNSTFKEQTTTMADLSIYGQETTAINGINEDANIINAGTTSDISIRLVGGAFNSSNSGGWTDITFNIVLPEGITLEGVNGRDFVFDYNGNIETCYTTDETVGSISITETEMTEEEAIAHFGENSGIKGGTIYTCTLDDADVMLYGYRYVTYAQRFTSFTVDATVKVDVTTSTMEIPWSDIIYLGSNSESYTTYSSFRKISTYENTSTNTYKAVDEGKDYYQTGTGENIDNFTDSLALGNTIQLVSGSSDEYLKITNDPQLMVHDAYIEADGVKYYYSENNSDSIAVLGSGEKATINYSVTNTVNSDSVSDTTSYVVFALPTLSSTSSLAETSDIVADISKITVNGSDIFTASDAELLSATDYSGISLLSTNEDMTVDTKFINIDDDTTISSDNAESTFDNGSSEYDSGEGYNAMILKVQDQDQYESFDVSTEITMPTDITEETQYTQLQGMSVYTFFGSSQTTSSSDNAIMFAYSNPEYDVDFAGYSVTDLGQIEDELTLGLADITLVTGTKVYETDTGDDSDIVLEAPDIEGHTFIGWYSDEDLTKEFFGDDNSGVAITSDTTIYAKYEIDKVEVTYVYNNGEDNYTKNVNYTDKISSSSTPEYDKHTFAGWCLDEDLKISLTATTYGEADTDGNGKVTLYAAYTENDLYTISYEDVEGFEDNEEYEEGDKVTIPTTLPTKTGYEFAGWLCDYDGKTYRAGTTFTVGTENVEFTAQWTLKNYTISYEESDGTTVKISDTAGYNTEIILGSPSDKTGYTFSYWDYNDVEYYAGDAFTMPAEDVTMIAVWEKTSHKVYLKGIVEGETGDEAYTYGDGRYYADVKYEESITLPTDLIRTGYTFDYWQDANGDKYEESTVTMKDESISLTAIWKINQYDVTYDVGDGDSTSPGTYDYGTIITLPTPTYTNHDFLRWELTIDGEIYQYAAGASYTIPADDVKFVAVWKVKTYVITFQDQEGNELLTKEDVYYNGTIELPTVLKTGYDFVKWTHNGEDYYEGDTFKFTSYSDITIVGVYTKIDYTVKFSGESVNIGDMTKGYGEEVTIPDEPTRTGYDFVYWIDEYGETYDAGDKFNMPVGGLNLTAVWDINEYELSFTETGDTTYNTVTLEYDKEYILPTPTMIGYTFDGWEKGDEVDLLAAGSTFKMEADNVKLEGQWTIINNDVVFNDGYSDNNTTENYDYGEPVTFPTVSREGYTFVGWSYNGSTYLSTDTFKVTTAGVEFTALWNANEYTISFDETGDRTISDVKKKYGSTYTLPIPTQEGYDFTGWKYGDDENSIYDAGEEITVLATNMIFTGTWELKTYEVAFDDGYSDDPITTKEYKHGDIVTFTDLTREGYEFNGWVYGDGAYLEGDEFEITEPDVTFEADWSAKEYEITFVEDGDNPIGTIVVDCDCDYTIPTATKDGFDFVYWTDSEGNIYEAGDQITMKASNLELTGVWEEIPEVVEDEEDVEDDVISVDTDSNDVLPDTNDTNTTLVSIIVMLISMVLVATGIKRRKTIK